MPSHPPMDVDMQGNIKGPLAPQELDVLVVGAGFGGLYQLYTLRKRGYKVKAVDSAPELGGIWYWNCYPGARVDSDVPVYEYSMEELWKGWTWTERCPGREELRRYFAYVDEKLDLSKDVWLNTRVQSAEFDLDSNRWSIHVDKGQVINAKFFVLCIGFSAKRYIPDFEGLDDFKGACHHTSLWPQEGVDFHGKKVAVIGTGASGVQVIQEMGPHVSHLTVFQRTPNLCLPMRQHPLEEKVQQKAKENYTTLFKQRCKTFAGFAFDFQQVNALDDSPEARRVFYERMWGSGGFEFWLGTYKDIIFDQKANDTAYRFWCEKTRARLHSTSMKDKLAPLKPPHAFGIKRPSLEQRYYEVFNQPNVDLIDTRANPITRFTPNGIRTRDGVDHSFDVIVLATGFDAVTGGLLQIDIKGTDGITMKEKWAKGISTYLGMTTSHFPNLFFIYGPHGPTSFANGPTCVEVQGDWVVACIEHLTKTGKSRIEPTPTAEERWTRTVAHLMDISLLPSTDSWYLGANIPGKTREALCYLGGIPRYMRECDESAKMGYDGFVIV